MPMLTPLIDKLRQFIERAQGMSEHGRRMAVVIGLVAASIGPVLYMLPILARGIKVVTGAIKIMNGTLAASPWGLIAIAIAGVGLAMYGLHDASTDAETQVKNLRKELNGMEAEEAARYAAQRIKEQEEAVKKQLEAVKALRAAANMGDATDRRIHSQTLARQEEVLTNEQKKLEGFKREAAILEGQQSYAESLARQGQVEADAVTTAADARERALDAARQEAQLMGWMEDYRELLREDIVLKPEVKPQFDPSNLPDDIEGLQIIPDATGADDFADDFNVDEVAFEKFKRTEERAKLFRNTMSSVMSSLSGSAAMMGSALGNAFGAMAKGAEDGKEQMKSATKGIIQQALAASQAGIIEAMINSGKFSGPAAPVVIPALVATGMGFLNSMFNDIPAFAAGGIVSGPTLGLMGEYSGAATNPEVIAPLDKLQSMMGGGGQQVTVVGKIDGNAIRLSNERATRNASRSIR
jgi:hypothetical protein